MSDRVAVRGYLRRRRAGSLVSTQTAASKKSAIRLTRQMMTPGERKRLKILRADPVPFSEETATGKRGPTLREYDVVIGVRKGKTGGWD